MNSHLLLANYLENEQPAAATKVLDYCTPKHQLFSPRIGKCVPRD